MKFSFRKWLESNNNLIHANHNGWFPGCVHDSKKWLENKMGRQGDGYWVRGFDGLADKVIRHELWLKNDLNLKKFGIEKFKQELDKYSAYNPNDQDTIRIIGMKAGLVRVRDNGGVISIQFDAARQVVSDYLYNTLQALLSVGLWGSSVYVNNLKYNDSINISWNEFKKNVLSFSPILVNESNVPITDVKYNPELMKKIEESLAKSGIEHNDDCSYEDAKRLADGVDKFYFGSGRENESEN